MDNTYEEVCIVPSIRHKSTFSEVDLTKVSEVKQEGERNRRVKGETIKFAGFITYLPITVCEEAINRLTEKDQNDKN